ncbi:MAG: FG-GAP repeat protein [Chitinophagaceae bacterium]|nr:FG-GAP repeat protein [Chitinophagaceae bacterium]
MYHGSAAGLSATPNNTPDDADQFGVSFGYSVASAGDVNGDGYSDVIIGAVGFDDGANTNEGRAFVYHGGAAGLSATPNSSPDDADQASAFFGISVASAGDVNGDGYSDVIIGAYGYDDGANANEGRAFVYHGSAAGLSSTPSSTPDDANQAGAYFGWSVSSAGDVNGDGYSDVIIGAIYYDDGANVDEGWAFVYHGSAAGLSATPNSTPDDANQAGAYFGFSVASAGDLNGDGYSDVIIGAYLYDDGANTDEGRAFVYHGGAAGLSATPNSSPDDADQAIAFFGCSVASAGDVNGDGYSDVIIGAYLYNDGANADEGRAFLYHGSATGLSATPNSTPDDADQASANFGISVASAGDVNGDGYSDVIIGAYVYDDGANTNEGRAFVYHGSPAGLSTTPNSTPDDADQAGANFGYSVASAGDVNGDGYSDVIIGAWQYDDGANATEGRAFVYHGSATGLSATPNSTPDDADQAGAGLGFSVAGAGDVNGDGYSDVIIGGPSYDDGFTGEGRAFVYHGGAAGLSATPNSTPDDADQANASFGSSVAGAGDVNGDGYSDVIIGADFYDDAPNFNEGRCFVYHGSATGLSATPNSTPDDGNQGAIFFGCSVASAGDVNGDGYSDVIIGAYSYNDGANTDEGRAFVYHGSATGLSASPNNTPDDANQADAFFGITVASAGDVNGDGYSDVIIGAYTYNDGANMDEGRAFVYHGSATGLSATPNNTPDDADQAFAYFGYNVASAGDLNGDGYSDVIVGAPSYDDGANTNEGRAFVYHGSATGLSAIPNSTPDDADQADAIFGRPACAGDVNGDGYSDVIIGAYLYDDGANTDEGRAFLYNGNELTANKRNNLRLYNTNLTTPINSSNFITGNFGTGLFARSFLGRAKGKLVWETRLNYNPWSGTPITNSVSFTAQQVSYTDMGIAGIEFKNLITKLLGSGKFTKLRARVKYDPVTAITGQVYSSWRYVSSIIDANNLGVLPIEMVSFNAAWLQKGRSAKLEFKTDKESGICCFDIEKSLDGFNFSTIGSLPAKNISGIQSYQFTDNNANNNKQFYRIKIKGISGQVEYSNIQQLQNNGSTEILVFPNPATDILHLSLNGSYSRMEVQVINAAGQTVIQMISLPVSNQSLRIPLNNLPPGRYWLRLQGGGEKQVLQFVKF